MPQLAAIKASLEIPAFNPDKHEKEKDRERRERREREELEHKEAESRRESREAREAKERERRERDERDRDRDRERREREREREREDREWELRRPSKDAFQETNKQPDVEGRLLADYEPPPIEQGLLSDPQQRGVGPTSLQKFNEQENETGEVRHLPNCEPLTQKLAKFISQL